MLHYSHPRARWEKPNERIPSLASRTDPALDQAYYPNTGLWTAFRFASQPCRADCRKCTAAPTVDRSESANPATSADQPWPFSPRVSFSLPQILETIDAYCSAGYLVALASEFFSFPLAMEVARQAENFSWNDCLDPKDGCRESVMGNRSGESCWSRG